MYCITPTMCYEEMKALHFEVRRSKFRVTVEQHILQTALYIGRHKST